MGAREKFSKGQAFPVSPYFHIFQPTISLDLFPEALLSLPVA